MKNPKIIFLLCAAFLCTTLFISCKEEITPETPKASKGPAKSASETKANASAKPEVDYSLEIE